MANDAAGGATVDPQDLADFERDGFLVIESFLATERCDQAIARSRRLIGEIGPAASPIAFSTSLQRGTDDDYFLTSGDKIRLFFDADAHRPDGTLRRPLDQAVNKIGHALHDLDPFFDGFSRDARLAAIARGLGIARPLLLQSTVIFKQAHTGGEVVSHQDSAYLFTDPPSCLGFWFALEAADVDNGCLWALPGGHRSALATRYRRMGDGTVRFDPADPPGFDEARFQPLPAAKGTLIVLHGLLPHRSGANRSARSRPAYTLHVIDGACRYQPDNWLVRADDLPLRGF